MANRARQLNVRLNEQTANELDHLTEALGRSKTQVVEDGIGMLAWVTEQTAQGNQVAIVDPDGQVIAKVVFK